MSNLATLYFKEGKNKLDDVVFSAIVWAYDINITEYPPELMFVAIPHKNTPISEEGLYIINLDTAEPKMINGAFYITIEINDMVIPNSSILNNGTNSEVIYHNSNPVYSCRAIDDKLMVQLGNGIELKDVTPGCNRRLL